MGWRGTAILTLLVMVIGAYVWFEEAPPDAGRAATFDDAPAPRQIATPVRPLLEFQPADVVGVRLERPGQVHEAVRTAGGWQDVANPTALDDLIHDLAQLGVLMDIPGDQAALKDYGLQPPQGVLQLRLRGRDTPLILEIGDRNPATTGVYVRVGGDDAVVLAGALVEWDFDRAFKSLAGG